MTNRRRRDVHEARGERGNVAQREASKSAVIATAQLRYSGQILPLFAIR